MPRMNTQHFTLLLGGLSGSCGLAYEIAYARLFSNYFGSAFSVTATILTCLFLGMAAGAWASRRWAGWLPVIELLIGVHAVIAVTILHHFQFAIVSTADAPAIINVAKISGFIVLPALLIGACVPLFADRLQRLRQEGEPGRSFSLMYAIYNLGALASILLIEFVLIRELGLRITIYMIAAINVIVAAGLFITRLTPPEPEPAASRWPRPDIATVVFTASLVSGIFQLYVLQLSFQLFGPLQENFAIVLATALLGLFAGAAFAWRRSPRIGPVLVAAGLCTIGFVLAQSVVIETWDAAQRFDPGPLAATLSKALIIAGFTLPAFICFGMMVPVAIAEHETTHKGLAGQVLAISSLGNGIGSLAMISVIYANVELQWIGIGLGAVLVMASVAFMPGIRTDLKQTGLKQAGLRQAGIAALAAMLLAGVSLINWPAADLQLGYKALADPARVRTLRQRYQSATVYKALNQNVALVNYKDGETALLLNGYQSLSFSAGSPTTLFETIVGATPAMFSDGSARALVLGLGSGISGGATARLYDETEIVDINPAVWNLPKHFTRDNGNVMNRASATITLQDGIILMLGKADTYDAIVNTVTSPTYYSASKLYTAEFYALVKTALKPGGTYSSWFDVTINRQGIDIMLNTLEQSFERCRYFMLAVGYFNVVCADGPLIWQPTSVINARFADIAAEPLKAQNRLGRSLVRLVDRMEMEFGKDFLTRETSDINTLDRPVIEFSVTQRAEGVQVRRHIGGVVDANLALQAKLPGGKQRVQEMCITMQRISGHAAKACAR